MSYRDHSMKNNVDGWEEILFIKNPINYNKTNLIISETQLICFPKSVGIIKRNQTIHVWNI